MKNPKQYLRIADDFPLRDRITIGKYTYGTEQSPRMNFYSGPRCMLHIGSFTSFAPSVVIHVGGEHRTDYISTFPFSEIFDDVEKIECVRTKGDVHIGSDVWVGSNVVILSGVTIGHGAVIGAGSVVSKNVLPYTIIGGNPARTIRRRFSDSQIEKLLDIKWWDWKDEKIDKLIPLILSNDIDRFIKRAEEMREEEDAV